ncbi:MAG: FeoB-associated Cys-rich membrane protein [Eubacteriales bacterium]
MLINLIVSAILILLIGGAIATIVRSKKRGETCVGCPYAGQCAKQRGTAGSHCGCSGKTAGDIGHKCDDTSRSDGSN